MPCHGLQGLIVAKKQHDISNLISFHTVISHEEAVVQLGRALESSKPGSNDPVQPHIRIARLRNSIIKHKSPSGEASKSQLSMHSDEISEGG